MYKIDKENKWLVLTDGRDVIHGPIENTSQTVTESGQPFAVFADTKEAITNLVFSEYVEANPEEKIEEIKTLREIPWITGYTLAEVNSILNDYNTTSTNSKIDYIKFPNQKNYAIPFQEYIFSTFPDGAIKDSMIAVVGEKITDNKMLSKEQMISDGWFN